MKIITKESYHRERLDPVIRLDKQNTDKAVSFSTYNSLKNTFKDKNDKSKYSNDEGKISRSNRDLMRSIEIKRQTGIEFHFQIVATVNRISIT